MLLHRARQFAEAGRGPRGSDYALARASLSPALLELFEAQHARDIVHASQTARWLLTRGYSDPDLIAAALVHDIGKGDQRRFDRVAHVLASAAKVEGRLADEHSPVALRRALARSMTHGQRSAELLHAAGARERVVELALRHHEPARGDTMLALLQQADAES